MVSGLVEHKIMKIRQWGREKNPNPHLGLSRENKEPSVECRGAERRRGYKRPLPSSRVRLGRPRTGSGGVLVGLYLSVLTLKKEKKKREKKRERKGEILV